MAKKLCNECGGTGQLSLIVPCTNCGGNGELVQPDGTVTECPKCINGYPRIHANSH